MPDEQVLPCKECGHSNEPQRVYCHNCGAKLDRSLLPVDSSKSESKSKVQKRVRKVMGPRRGFFATWKSSLFNAIIWSLVAAGLVQAVRPPADAPKELSRDEMGDYVNFADILYNAMHTPVSQRVSFKQDDVNKFLANTVKGKTTGLIDKELKFVRTFVQFDEGVVKISTQQAIYDFPIYASCWYTLEIRDGELAAKCVGGTVGRLPIHPLIMEQASYFMHPLWDVLKSERRSMSRMKEIELKKGEIIITTPTFNPNAPQPKDEGASLSLPQSGLFARRSA